MADRDDIAKKVRERRQEAKKKRWEDPEQRGEIIEETAMAGLGTDETGAAYLGEEEADPEKEKDEAHGEAEAQAEGEPTAEGEQPPETEVEVEAGEAEGEHEQSVDPNAETRTLTIDGQKQNVPLADIIQAGIEAKQKQLAVGGRFRELREYEGRLESAREELGAWEANLKNGLDREGNPIKATEAAGESGPTPSGDALSELTPGSKEAVERAIDAIMRVDSEEAAEELAKAVTDMAQGRSATPPSVEEVAAVVRRQDREDAAELERREVNARFAATYPEIEADEDLTDLTRIEYRRLSRDPEWAAASTLERSMEAGRRIAELEGIPPRSRDESDTDDPLAARRNAKSRRSASTRTVSSSRRSAPPKPPAPVSRSQVVKQMRKARGLH